MKHKHHTCTCVCTYDMHTHYFETIVGRGHLLEYLLLLSNIILPNVMCEVNNHDDCRTFAEELQLCWMFTTGNHWCLCWYQAEMYWSNLHHQWWQGMILCKFIQGRVFVWRGVLPGSHGVYNDLNFHQTCRIQVYQPNLWPPSCELKCYKFLQLWGALCIC